MKLKKYKMTCIAYKWRLCQINFKNTKNHNKYYYAGLVLLYFKVWISPSDALSFLQRISGACFTVTRIVFNEYQARRPKIKAQKPTTKSHINLIFGLCSRVWVFGLYKDHFTILWTHQTKVYHSKNWNILVICMPLELDR